jgi:hypothetical protein
MMMLIGWGCFLGGVFMGLLLGSFLKAKCIHDWEPVVERELPSQIEEMKKHGVRFEQLVWSSDVLRASSKKFFALVSCKKCGGIKEFETRT